MPPKAPVAEALAHYCDMTDFVNKYIHLVPAPLALVSQGIHSFALPHTHYLCDVFNADTLGKAHQTDRALRNESTLNKSLNYDDFLVFADIAVLSLSFILLNYNNPNIRVIYPHPIESYSTIIAILIRLKLDNSFDLIKQYQEKKTTVKRNKLSLVQINKKINETYHIIQGTLDIFKTHINDYGHLMTRWITTQYKTEFYQCYFEAMLFRAQSNPEYTHTELASLGTDACIALLEETAETAEHRLDLYLTKSRNALVVHKAKERALTIAEQGIHYLHSLAFDDSLDDNSLFDYHNHFMLLSAAIQRNITDEALITSLSSVTAEQMTKLYDTLLAVKETIRFSHESIQLDFTAAIHHAIQMLTIKVAGKISLADHATLESFEQLAKKAFEASRLLTAIKSMLKTKEVKVPSDDHTKSILNIISEIRKKSQELTQCALNNEMRYQELALKIQTYEAQFSTLLASFESKTRKILKKRTITTYTTPSTLPDLPSNPDASNQPPLQAPTLAQRAHHFFTFTSYEHIPDFLKSLADEELAEGLLYVGDYYFTHGDLPAALDMYEQAIKQCHLTMGATDILTIPIKMQLEDTKAAIEKQLKRTSLTLAQLESSRLAFIIQLGIQKLKQAGATAAQLDPDNEEYREAIIVRGKEAYKNIGAEKQMKGAPHSEKTQVRQSLKSTLNYLNKSLEKTNQLLNSVSEIPQVDNFPSLQHSATLFQHNNTASPSKAKKPKPGQRKSRFKK